MANDRFPSYVTQEWAGLDHGFSLALFVRNRANNFDRRQPRNLVGLCPNPHPPRASFTLIARHWALRLPETKSPVPSAKVLAMLGPRNVGANFDQGWSRQSVFIYLSAYQVNCCVCFLCASDARRRPTMTSSLLSPTMVRAAFLRHGRTWADATNPPLRIACICSLV